MAGFLFGRLLTKCRFRADAFPFKANGIERDGRFFQKIRIREWQSKLPDMSRVLPSMIPPKQVSRDETGEHLENMIQETCIAEVIHVLLCLAGIRCAYIWRGAGGAVISVLNALGNILFIMVQRYNRPRLMRLCERIETYQSRVGAARDENLDFDQ